MREGIYELRIRLQRVNYRMMYFYHGKTAAVISHGILKEKEVPPREIDTEEFKRKQAFISDPERHTYAEP